jgi:RHS repeat-associated protein
MRLPGLSTTVGRIRPVAVAALAVALAASGRAGTLDDRALARALEDGASALREGRSAEARAALRAQLARLERADAAHRARFARAAGVAGSGDAAGRVEQARAAYDAGQGRLLALLREAQAAQGPAAAALLDEAQKIHERIEAASAPPPVSATPRVRAPRLTAPPLPVAAPRGTEEPQTLEQPIGPVPEPLRQAAAALAGPIEVYEWVRNSIRPEFYHGRMKGPVEAFRERSGNDVDTAGVLVEMLRAKGVPARYVRAVAEVPAPVLVAVTGTADVTQALRVLARAGIPHQPIAGPAGPTAVRLHRVFVEALVPYANYRGAVIDNQGSVWLPLDASFKAMEPPVGRDVVPLGFDPRQAFDAYLGAAQTATPLEAVRARVTDVLAIQLPGTTYPQVLNQRTFAAERLGLLPSTLPYKVVSVAGVGYDVDEDLRQRLRVVGEDAEGVFLDATVDTADLLGRRVTIGYRPETEDDRRIVETYGGLHLTPPYLIKVVPALKIGGVPVATGSRGIGMAVRYELRIALTTPGGTEEVVNRVQAGNLLALGLAGRQPAAPDPQASAADQILARVAIDYFARWNASDDELADLLRVVPVRPLPSVCLVQSDVEVEYAGGDPLFPLTFDWKGILVDADLRPSAPVGIETSAAEARFLLLSGLEGSVQEDRVFAQGMQIAAVSTAQAIGLAASVGTTVHDLTRDNVDAVLPTLPFDPQVKEEIRDAALSGLLVRVPAAPVNRLAWTGVGYVLLDEETGEAAWQIQGGHSGGVTAPAVVDIPEEIVDPLIAQGETIEPAPEDAQVRSIQRFVSTDFQEGTVDKRLERPLRVLVTDEEGRAVRNANVTFAVIGGGGKLVDPALPNFEAPEITARSNERGEAEVVLRLGKRTDEIPRLVLWEDPEREPSLVGLNVVTARAGLVSLEEPFTALGFADSRFDGTHSHADLRWSGNYVRPHSNGAVGGRIRVVAEDPFGNPISNFPIVYTYRPPAIAVEAEPGFVRMRQANDSPSRLLSAKKYRECIAAHPVPLSGQCAGEVTTLTLRTSWLGAEAYVALGDSPLSTYFIDAATDVEAVGWASLPTSGYVCPVSDPFHCTSGAPSSPIIASGVRLFRANALGNVVEAYPLGGTASMSFWADAISEKERVIPFVDPEGVTHYRVEGTNEWRRERLSDSTIRLQPTTPGTVPDAVATPLGNGTYGASIRMGTVPQYNHVRSQSEHYPLELMRKFYWNELDPDYVDPVTLAITRVRAPYGPWSESSGFGLWGIDVRLSDLQPTPVQVGAQGTVTEPSSIRAHVDPPEYRALLTPTDILFEIVRGGETVLAANGTGAQFSVPAGLPYPSDPHQGLLSVIGVSVVAAGGSPNVVSEPLDLPGCHLLALQTPVVEIELTADRVNGSVCAEDKEIEFFVCRASNVTLRVGGQVFEGYVDDGTAPVRVENLPLEAGLHKIKIPPAALEADFLSNPAPQKPFVVRGVEIDDPTRVQEAAGLIKARTLNRAVLPVGHTFVKSVDLADGHVTLGYADVTLAGRHLGLTASRTYSSSGANREGLLGAGWGFSYESQARVTSCQTVVVQTADGSNQMFQEAPQGGGYIPQKGYHGRLVRNADASFDYVDKAGVRHHFEKPDATLQPRGTYRLRYMEEPHGDRIVANYDEQERLTRVAEVHPESGEVRWLEFRYVERGGFDRISRIASSLGHVAVYTYDDWGNLTTAERQAPDATWRERYDYSTANPRDRHQIVAVQAANGNRTTYAYYAESDALPGWDPQFSIGKTELTRRVTEYPGTSGGVAIEFLYDLSEALATRWKTTVRDARGNPTRYVMNGYGAVFEMHEPLGRATFFEWAPDDVLKKSEKDANGRVTRYAHDGRGNLTEETVTSADGSTTVPVGTYAYEPSFNKLTLKRDGDGRTTTYEIDPLNGDVLSMTDPVAARTSYEYDAHGRLLSETDHADHVTTYADHDSFGHARAVTRPLALTVQRTYDARGRMVEEQDSFGHESETTYDGFDRPLTVRRKALDPDSADALTTTAYYPAGQARRTTNANGATTEITLDGMDRVIRTSVSGPGLSSALVSASTYDGNGNRVTERDPRGVERRTTFDALNQATQVEITAGPGGGPTGVVSRATYDPVGNKASETDLAGLVTSFTHDLLYRVKRRTLPESGPAGAYFEEYEYDLAGNLTLRRDANGHTRTFTYDGHNRRVTWQDEAGHARRMTFDLAAGRLDRPSEDADDTAGRRTTFVYDALHRETERRVHLEGTGGDGAVYLTSTAYPSGRVSVTTDPRLEETRVERDGLDRPVVQRVDPEGLDLTTRTVYDGLGNPTSVTDPRGKVTRSTYDSIGRLLEVTDADDQVTTTEYDGGGLKTSVTDRRDVRRNFTYDNLGRPRTESIVPSISGVPWSHETRYEDVARRRLSLDALVRTTTQELDGLGRVVREIDADGKDRLFTYDGVNKRSETDKRPEHHVTTFTYDVFDRLVETVHPPLDGEPEPFTSTTVYQDATNTRVDTDRRGIATTTRMDPLGRTREVARGDALVERHTYDGNGNRVTSLDAEANQTAFEYDAANRLVRRTDGVGTATESSITYTPDANGNVLEERDARAVAENQPFSVKRTYDSLNRPQTETDGLEHTSEQGWDPEGNRIRVQTRNGDEHLSTFDELAKLTSTTEPVTGTPAAVTRHEYDANRNRTDQTDARSNAVEMQYDDLGRLKAMVQPGGLTTARDYDANGNVLVLTDPKGQTVTSTYDEWNRMKTKVYAFAPGETYRPWRWIVSIAYQYDANDNPIRIEETVASGTDPPPPAPNQITTRTYDDFDRMLSETVTLPDGGTKTVSYTYFKNGNRKTLTDPAGIVTSYTYDGQNRLETVTTPEGVTTYTYWPDDLLKTVTYPSGVVSSYGYDLADRLTSLESRQGATVVSSYAYTYDANGNRLSQTETNGGALETTTYTYDARDRLATVTYPPDEISATGRVVTYTYDEVGNRLTELTTDPVSGAQIGSKSGTFDALNRLTVLEDLLDPPATVTFDYDDNGNQTAKTVGAPGGPGDTTAFRYDVRDKLVEVETPTVIAARMEYDAAGRLAKKIGEDGIRQYVYDEDSRFLEYDTAGLQVAKYSYGADRLISLVRSDEGTRFYHLDGLGSVTALTDPSGVVTSRLHLDAWGVFRNPDEMNGPGASRNRFAFTGYVFDRETELYFAKARFYDPTVGRFTSQDSFLGDIDAPPSLHRYFYGHARPTVMIDPTGHIAFLKNIQDGLDERRQGLIDAAGDFSAALQRTTGIKHAEIDQRLGAVTGGAAGLAGIGSQLVGAVNFAANLAAHHVAPGSSLGREAFDELYQTYNSLSNAARTVVENPKGVGLQLLESGKRTALGALQGDPTATAQVSAAYTEIVVDLALGSKGLKSALGAAKRVADASTDAAETLARHADDLPLLPRVAGGSQGADALDAVAELPVDDFTVGLGIKTPFGVASQSTAREALQARLAVQQGADLYRLGTMGTSRAAEAPFWALEHPFSPDFAPRYGVPRRAIERADFMVSGRLRPEAPFITRVAPGTVSDGIVHSGGAIEVVTEVGGVRLKSFSVK